MDTQAIQAQHETLNAIVDACHACGLKLKPDAETVLLEKITAKGVSASAGAMGLELAQGSTQIVVSSALKTLYAENPDLFYYDPRIAPSDVVVCRADLNHGTQQEILQRKAKWISEHGEGDYERLPATREEAQRRATVPSATMSRAEYQCLSLRDKAALCAAIGAIGIQKIMARTK